ncbi:MAG: hypothetical protein V4617_09905 [Gemmatimonadota bacterium]
MTYTQLVNQANTAFGAGSPNANSVIGKLGTLKKLVEDGDVVGAKARAHDIASFTLQKNEDNPLPGGEAAIATFLTSMYCYAGLNIPVTDPINSTLILPTDEPQIVYNDARDVGVKFPQFPVNAPTLIVIKKLTAPPLTTKLDQYPGFVSIEALAGTGVDPFAGVPNFFAIVGVCATAPKFLFDQNRLILGHGIGTTTELTPRKSPAAEGIALICKLPSTTTASSKALSVSSIAAVRAEAVRAAGTTASALAPEDLEAFAGGVGGTVKEFSPFAPVDGELEMFAGGVGGTVKEFIRASSLLASSFSDPATATLVSASCATNTFEGAIGSVVGCRPALTVSTFKGTLMYNVPVDWTVLSGGGSITPNTPGAALPDNCGSVYASTASTQTSIAKTVGTTSIPGGIASVCWKLGSTPGANSLTAVARFGGDAPEGVVFDNGGTATFTATGNPPSQLVFTPALPATQTAGTPFSATVEVRDKNGERVFGYNGTVTVTLNQHTFAPVPPAVTGPTSVTVTAVNGVANFSLTINKAATGYTLTPSLVFGGGTVTGTVSSPFNVGASSATVIEIVSGNGQTAAAGSNVASNPTVRVKDSQGNLVEGATVAWTPTNSSAAVVNPATSTTGATGTTFTVWTVGDGANELKAAIGSGLTEKAVYFTATGTSTLAVLNSCPVGGGRDAVNDPGVIAAFWMSGPANRKTLRSIQLYFGATGRAEAPTTYGIEMTVQTGTFEDIITSNKRTVVVPVTLRGSASENAPVTFTLPQPIVGTTASPDVMVQLRVVSSPDNARILFNTGGKGCFANQVSSLTPYPRGTLLRAKAVAMVLKGN